MSELYLPAMKDHNINEGIERGTWANETDFLNQLAEHLDAGNPDSEGYESSKPTIWDRFLFFRDILGEKKHPLQEDILNQWIGLRVTIGLKTELRELIPDLEIIEEEYPHNDFNGTQIRKILKNMGWPSGGYNRLTIYILKHKDDCAVIGGKLGKVVEEVESEEYFTPPEILECVGDYIPWFNIDKKRFKRPELHYLDYDTERLFIFGNNPNKDEIKRKINYDIEKLINQMKDHVKYSDFEIFRDSVDFTTESIFDYQSLIEGLKGTESDLKHKVFTLFDVESQKAINSIKGQVDNNAKSTIINEFNRILNLADFYSTDLDEIATEEIKSLKKEGIKKLCQYDLKRLNRLVFELIFPEDIAKNLKNAPQKIAILEKEKYEKIAILKKGKDEKKKEQIIYGFYTYDFLQKSIEKLRPVVPKDQKPIELKSEGEYIDLIREVENENKEKTDKIVFASLKCPWVIPEEFFFTKKVFDFSTVEWKHLLYKDDFTIIPPLHSNILRFLNISSIEKSIECKEKKDTEGKVRIGAEISLTLKLMGENPVEESFKKIFTKDDFLTSSFEPFNLAIWPNFKENHPSTGSNNLWEQYYVIMGSYPNKLYFDEIHILSKKGITVIPNLVSETNLKIKKFDACPDAVILLKGHEEQGMLFPKFVDLLKPANRTVKVALDFGTSNTCWRYSESAAGNNKIYEKDLESLILPLTKTTSYEIAILEDFVTGPGEVKSTFSSIFRSRIPASQNLEPIEDGEILFADYSTVKDSLLSKTITVIDNLKWQSGPSRSYIKVFLKHTMMLICAALRKEGVKKIESLHYSYPSILQGPAKDDYDLAFNNVWDWTARQKFGLSCNANAQKPFSEGVAAATYINDIARGAALANDPMVVLDIGGGSTEIAIWLGGHLLVHTSIRLACNIIASYAFKNKDFCKYTSSLINVFYDQVESVSKGKEFALFNLVMRYVDENGNDGYKKYFEDSIQRDKITDILNLIYFAFSALYFYAGILLKSVCKNRADNWGGVTYIATGNGIRLLDLFGDIGSNRQNAIRSSLEKMMKAGFEGNINFSSPNIVLADPKEVIAKGLLHEIINIAENKTVENTFKYPLGEEGFKYGKKDLEPLDDLRHLMKVEEMREQAGQNHIDIDQPSTFTILESFIEKFQEQTISEEIYSFFKFRNIKTDFLDEKNQNQIRTQIHATINRIWTKRENIKKPEQPFFTEEVKEVISVLWKGAKMDL